MHKKGQKDIMLSNADNTTNLNNSLLLCVTYEGVVLWTLNMGISTESGNNSN
jgi:hypothetical protein